MRTIDYGEFLSSALCSAESEAAEHNVYRAYNPTPNKVGRYN